MDEAQVMNWIQEWQGFKLVVPIKTHVGEQAYHIHIAKRPTYCDRGDWLIHVRGGDLDEADGFPRYFIGSEDEVKAQMESWLARRAAYQRAIGEKATL
jgi:hypothetical protein